MNKNRKNVEKYITAYKKASDFDYKGRLGSCTKMFLWCGAMFPAIAIISPEGLRSTDSFLEGLFLISMPIGLLFLMFVGMRFLAIRDAKRLLKKVERPDRLYIARDYPIHLL